MENTIIVRDTALKIGNASLLALFTFAARAKASFSDTSAVLWLYVARSPSCVQSLRLPSLAIDKHN